MKVAPSENGTASSLAKTVDSIVSLENILQEENHSKWLCVINPNTNRHLGWVFLTTVLVLYSIFMVPTRVAFEIGEDGRSPVLWLDILVDLLFIADMYIQAHLAFKVTANSDEYVTSRCEIRWNYFTSWFIVDLIASLPMDIVLLAVEGTGEPLVLAKLFKTLRLIRVSRMIKLIRVVKLKGLINDLEDRFDGINLNPGVRKLLQTVFLVVVISHVTACLWYFVSSNSAVSSTDPMSWSTFYFPSDENQQDTAFLYTVSLYWAVNTLTSVGFGDIVARNSSERIVAIFICWIGASVFGYAIGQMSSIIADINRTSYVFHRRMDSINAYLKYRKVPIQLQKRIKRYYRYYIERQLLFDEKRILNDLSHYLRVELSMFLSQDILETVHLFKDISDRSFLSAIVSMLKPLNAAPGDVIMRHGDLATEIFIILRGSVKEDFGNDQVFATYHGGQHFGESIKLVPESNERRTSTVTAVTHCDLMSLSKSDLKLVVRDFPQVKERMELLSTSRKAVARNFQNQTKAIAISIGGSKKSRYNSLEEPDSSSELDAVLSDESNETHHESIRNIVRASEELPQMQNGGILELKTEGKIDLKTEMRELQKLIQEQNFQISLLAKTLLGTSSKSSDLIAH